MGNSARVAVARAPAVPTRWAASRAMPHLWPRGSSSPNDPFTQIGRGGT